MRKIILVIITVSLNFTLMWNEVRGQTKYLQSATTLVDTQSEQDNKKIDENIKILARKIKSNKQPEEVKSELKKMGEKAIPRLKELSNSEDKDIRGQAFVQMLEVSKNRDEIFLRTLSDTEFNIKLLPFEWLKYKGKNEKSIEYKKWQNKLQEKFDQREFNKIVEEIKVWRSKEYSATYPEEYLFILDNKCLPLIKKYTQETSDFVLLPVFYKIEENHPEHKYGLDFLIELLDVNIKKLIQVGKTEKEIGRELVRPARSIYLIAVSHPEIFDVSNIEKLEIFMAPMKGKNIFLVLETSDNMYSIIEHTLQKINKGKN